MRNVKTIAICVSVFVCATFPAAVSAQTVKIFARYDGRVTDVKSEGQILESGSGVLELESPLLSIQVKEREREIGIREREERALRQRRVSLREFSRLSKEKLERRKNRIENNNKLSSEQKSNLILAEVLYNKRDSILEFILGSQVARHRDKTNALKESVRILKEFQSFKCPFKCKIDRVLVKTGQWVPTGTVLMEVSNQR